MPEEARFNISKALSVNDAAIDALADALPDGWARGS